MKPCIHILTSRAEAAALKNILAGLEEEGMLWEVCEAEKIFESQDNFLPLAENHISEYLAAQAALMSPLELGIGLCGSFAALTIQKLKSRPMLTTTSRHRTLGQNAGRFVKLKPLKEMDNEDLHKDG